MESDPWDPDCLRAERKRHGWSQAKVAKVLGVDITTVRRWEAGRAVPYSHHRTKMSALFAKLPEELDLLFDEQEEPLSPGTLPDTAAEASLLADPATPETMSSARRDESRSIKQFLSPRSLWHSGLSCINHLPTFRSLNRFSRHRFLIILTMLLVVLLIFGVLSAFLRPKQASPSVSKSHAEMTYGPPWYALKILSTDASLRDSAQRIQNVFNMVYAQLVNRFALDPASVDKNIVTLTFSSDLASSAQTSGTTITVNSQWIQQHPTQMGLLTHELTLVAERYPSGVPVWFADGLADYARSIYGPADDNWSLPDGVQPHESYLQGGGVAARFLLWLELHTRLDIVNQLNHALQKGQSFSTIFRSLTHTTVDDLWNQYQAQPDITPAPQQRYKIATSGKPLFQSSYHLKAWGPSVMPSINAEGLYLSNFVVQADNTILHGKDAGGGFFFRGDEYNNWHSVYFFANGSYCLGCQDYSLYHTEPFTFSSAIKVGLNRTNRLTVIVQKYRIYLYINGQFMTKVENTRLLSSGILGVRTSWCETAAVPDVQFDNFQVF